MFQKVLFVYVFSSIFLNSLDAAARPFDRLRDRRASKRQQGTAEPTGSLRINREGGFKGNLPDSYYTDYFQKQGIGQENSACPSGTCQINADLTYEQPRIAIQSPSFVVTPEIAAPAPPAQVVVSQATIETRIDTTNVSRMEKLLQAMEKRLGVETKPATNVNELLNHLPTVRVQIISHDGKEVESADIDIEKVVLKMIGNSGKE